MSKINAAKRLLVKLRKAHPKLPFNIGGDKVTYRNSWVTDISVNTDNIVELVKAGRCRWKIENETFNTLKNQGRAH